ncbi:PQQ-binding-like beta-propeller repeat protein [Mycolicibacterium sp. XJ662]
MAVTIAVIAGLVGGGYALVKRWTTDGADGSAVAGQLRGTFPDRPSIGWRLSADTIFDRAEFVQPEPTSYQYRRAGFIDLGDTLVTSAVLPQSDRSATLVAIDAATGDVRWTAYAGFAPVCATATIDGLLPCLGQDSRLAAPDAPPLPPYVHFLRMSDGGVDHQLPVSEYTRAVETDGTAVYTMGYQPSSNVRVITRGTVDDLTADWQQRYRLNDDGEGCVGSGDTVYDGVEGDVVYSGIDAGMVVADVTDGRRLPPMEVLNLSVYPTQGLTAEICDGADPDIRSTIVVDTEGATLRTVDGSAAHPWLVASDEELPYIIGRSAYDFASGRQLWTAAGGGDAELHTVIGDTVLGGGRGQGPLVAFDLATGQHLWTSDISPSEIDLSDGQRVMVETESGLVAVNLATGQPDWTLTGIEGWRSVAPAGDGFAHASNEFVEYYPPTGGPSVAPGRVGDEGGSTEDSSGLITKCGRTPEMTPVEYRAENGSLIVTMKVTARCPGGDIVSTDRLRVTISDGLGRICSAVFDFSRDPLVLGGDGAEPTTVELEFGSGSFSRHPNTLGDRAGQASGATEIVTESTASGTEVVDCEDEGTSSGMQSAERRTERMSVKSAGTPADDSASACGSDADALEALRAQVDADRPFVQSRLSDRWVAQLSSKRPGLVAPDVDGRVLTWTPCEILQQHLRMRGQYPEVRLAWSDEWRTFDLAGWWVTVAGVTFPGPNEANGWCDARAIPVDECYAKVVSNTRDSRGSTKYRR